MGKKLEAMRKVLPTFKFKKPSLPSSNYDKMMVIGIFLILWAVVGSIGLTFLIKLILPTLFGFIAVVINCVVGMILGAWVMFASIEVED